ncbi:hypothetical protein [Streptomyces sp. NPDC085479]|uniref:hypothetical protein n=1 Tax=Streptomyces sp. NPDC085479 TaxID=3365726 RepID=UPI0037D12F7C
MPGSVVLAPVAVVESEGVLEGRGDVRAQRRVLLHGVHVRRLDCLWRGKHRLAGPLALHDLHHPAAEDLQQAGPIRAEAQDPVDEVDVLELESEGTHGVDDQVGRELRGEGSDHGRCLGEVAERPVPGKAGEALYGVQPGEDDLRAAAGVVAQAAQPPGLRAFGHVGLEEAVALVEQDEQSPVGVLVEPGGDAVRDPLPRSFCCPRRRGSSSTPSLVSSWSSVFQMTAAPRAVPLPMPILSRLR